MFKMEDKSSKNLAKNVLVLPLIVIFVACSSKQIKNASTEPLDLPAEDSASYSDASDAENTYGDSTSYNDSSLADSSLSTPPVSDAQYSEPMPSAAPVKSIKKKAKKKRGKKVAAKGTVRKKSSRPTKKVSKVQDVPQPSTPTDTPSTSAAATLAQELPVIGEENLQTAPIEMPPIAPPIPPTEIEAEAQPNWMLAAFIIAGIVALGALGLRVRRHAIRKRGLIFN